MTIINTITLLLNKNSSITNFKNNNFNNNMNINNLNCNINIYGSNKVSVVSGYIYNNPKVTGSESAFPSH
ncbi:expressed protein [Dictyostelium purpureum]|uniref:Expressed protein n=1 Tax=Dictyostelium purpureum TaxID=5786 RepID=F0ZXS7_DICPU|nr:uncharacterized protein DICPUDRAFT_92825 [Dictyostelium purpureum]EGC31249.1 expressed protein [Dictyostelium purpureum]|eukprot:XP_003292227.1 expressed protein [Dictyostelium purpureum]